MTSFGLVLAFALMFVGLVTIGNGVLGAVPNRGDRPVSTQPLAPLGGAVQLTDGVYRTSPGRTRVSLSASDALVGQSFAFDNRGGGCQVFAVRGPATHTIVDGEYWLFPDAVISDGDLQRLAQAAAAAQQRDPAAGCASIAGWTVE